MTLWVLTVSISFSQHINHNVSLKPDTILVDTNGVPTHFGWRVHDQVPLLAEHIVRAEAAEQIENAQDSAIVHCDTIIAKQNVLTRSLRVQVDNREQKVNNQSIIIDSQKKENRRLNLTIKKLNVKLILFPIGAAVVGYSLGKLF